MKNRNLFIIVFMVFLVSLLPKLSFGQGRLLFKSVYTYTGKSWQEGKQPIQSNLSAFTCYIRIFDNCLIETSRNILNSSPLPQDIRYTYVGNNNNYRVYKNNNVFYFVDSSFGITKLIESYDVRYGWGNVTISTFYEYIIGDYSEEIYENARREYMNSNSFFLNDY